MSGERGEQAGRVEGGASLDSVLRVMESHGEVRDAWQEPIRTLEGTRLNLSVSGASSHGFLRLSSRIPSNLILMQSDFDRPMH